ncbi:MAG: Spy/CpxP family protein refolding chaperone [Vicinamibacterales bacterium]
MMEHRNKLKIAAVVAIVAAGALVAGAAVQAQGGQPALARGAGMMARGAGMMAQGAGIMAQGRMMRQGPMRGPMGPAGGGPMGFGRSILAPRLARQLELTETQRAEIRTVMESHRTEARALAEKGQPIRQQLHDAVVSNNTAAIDSLARELGQLQAENAKLRAKVRAEVLSKLTPDQVEKLRTIEAQVQQRMKRLQQERQQLLRQRLQERQQRLQDRR